MSNRATTHAKDIIANLTTVPTAKIQQHIALEVTMSGMNDAFWVKVGIAVISLILAFFLKRKKLK
ncbi:hypothetical protein [Bacillus sp. 165]|uniref:hypothetical protein n=1 Tax=Bacillus sp. 165 TaxID=1529117 RepID=UPI001ADBD1AF|nr:hypothetical protein [Bacillus sp. 165]MBO9131006.1 hypothetical protein [Bacillus sp. 165]